MIRKAILALLIAPALLVAVGTQAALTQDNGETPGAAEVKEESSAEERVKALEEKVKRLEERVEELEEKLAEATARDEAEEPDDAGNDADEMDDYWERYVASFKKGRKWTYELQGGMHMMQEVIRVDDDEAVVKTTVVMNGNPVGEPQETPYTLTQPEDEGEPAGESEMPEWQEKKITVKAGTFDCISFDGNTWIMKKYPIIVVKADSMELAEFEE